MAQYPNSNPTDQDLFVAVNNAGTTLSAGINNSVTTIPVNSTVAFPSDGVITIGSEIIHYSSKDATNFLGCTRAYDGSTAVAHVLNDPVLRNVVAADHNNLKDEIVAMAPDTRTMRNNVQNLLENGGFEEWNFGTYSAGNAEGQLADHWGKVIGVANWSTRTISKETIETHSGVGSSLKFEGVKTSGSILVSQEIPQITDYYGKNVTVSAWVKTSTANAVRIGIQNGTTSYSSYHTGGGGWERLTVTKTIAATNNLSMYLVFDDSCIAYVDECMANVGDEAMPFRINKKHKLEHTLKQNVKNLLVNGGCEVWQRGTNFVDPSGAWTADKWNWSQIGVTTFTVSRESTIIDRKNYSMKCVATVGGGATRLRCANSPEAPMHDYQTGRRTIITARVWSDTPGCKLMVSYTGQFFASAVDHPGDSQWHTLGMVTNINNSGFNVHVGWDSGATGGEAPPAGTVTFYIDSVMVTQGEVGENQPAAIPYMQEDPALEMTRCERHYEVASAIDTRWHFPAVKSPANVTYSYWRYHFRTFKSAAPTITITENTVFLHQNPTDGNTNSGDVASTATQTAAEVNEQGWRLNISYGTNQSTYNVIELQGNWEAEV